MVSSDEGFQCGVIRLHEPRGVYYSGQELSGSVDFQLTETLTFYAITINYQGEANVLWKEKETEEYNGVKRHKVVDYVGHEQYFKYSEHLLGGNGTSQLPPGQHSLPFKYLIPRIAPSSFKGDRGQVTYQISANLQHIDPSKRTDELVKEFEVVAPLNLNLGSPDIRQPIELDFEEVYGCDCICTPKPINIRVRLPVSGYCPGQTIPISVDAQNDSGIEVTKMVFKLTLKEKYHTQNPISDYVPPEKVLAAVKRGPAMSNTKNTFTCDLVVPDMIAPNLENCSIIDIGYFIKITIKLSGCNDDLEDESEICLGLVPLDNFTNGNYIHPMSQSLPLGPIPDPNIPQINVQNPPVPYQTQNVPYQTQNVPYQPQNMPYPPDHMHRNNEMPMSQTKPKPFHDYEIGFKAPESQIGANPPYPTVDTMAGLVKPPYPIENRMPQINNMPSVYPNDGLMGTKPSAPPPF